MTTTAVTPIEVLYRMPPPFGFDLAHDLAAAIEGAIPDCKVTDIHQDTGYAFLRIRPAEGFEPSTLAALQRFSQMPGAVVVDVASTPASTIWLRARMR